MDYRYYEKKINDVIIKCPIEAGVEILVYNVVESTLENDDLSLVDINRIWKNQDKRLTTGAGIPDIAVLSSDFEFKDLNKGRVYGFIEVKATNVAVTETSQIKGEKDSTRNLIYTNGLVWKIYRDGNLVKDINLTEGNIKVVINPQEVKIEPEKFEALLEVLRCIDWTDMK